MTCVPSSREVLIAPLKGGLPGREPQILKTLILSVCLFVCVCGFSSRFTERHLRRLQAQILFGLFFRGPKPDPPFRQRTHGRALQRGPKIFDVFSIFVQLKCACSDGLFCEIEIVMSPQFVGFSTRKSPFQGGRLPRGSKLVYLEQSTLTCLQLFQYKKMCLSNFVDNVFQTRDHFQTIALLKSGIHKKLTKLARAIDNYSSYR